MWIKDDAGILTNLNTGSRISIEGSRHHNCRQIVLNNDIILHSFEYCEEKECNKKFDELKELLIPTKIPTWD